LFPALPGQRRDVEPVRRVSSITIGPVQPSPLPRRHRGHHPRRCGSTGRQDAAMPAAVHPTASRQLRPRASIRTTTKREAHTPPPSKPLLDGYRARHDALPAARFSRTAIYSATLCAIPLHVIRIVWHVCKLPPLVYKRRGQSPSRRGRTESTHANAHCLHHDIGTCFKHTSGTWGPASFPTSLVAPLCKHHRATQYSATSTPLLDVRPLPEPG
jgi:hypothetical protein